MPTPDKIATLRRAACRRQDRLSDDPRAVVTFEGGSLDGIRLSVPQREALSPSLGFRTLRDSGPVQVLYADSGQAMIDAGDPPEVVTQLLGRKSSQMVWTYSSIRDERLVEAGQVLMLRKRA